MHAHPRIQPTLPASDIDRARRFYEDMMGFTPKSSDEQGVTYEGADGTHFFVFPSTGRPSGTHTQLGFEVDDVDTEVRDLKGKGVTFEAVDMEGYDPSTSIVSNGPMRAAWFKDTEGNLLAIANAFTSEDVRSS